MNALSFGDWLKRRRRSLDLTQAELADQAGCSVETIRKLEAETLRPSKALTDRLAAYLAIPPEQHDHFARFARGQSDGEYLPIPILTLDPARSPPSSRPHHLPAPLPTPPTPLVGRERQTREVCHLLQQPHIRLLTLIGAGGVGKTRLAIQAAADLQDDFAHGVCFVALSAVHDPSLVMSTVAHTVGVRESGTGPLIEGLVAWLRDKTLLLVLDNFEQVLAAAPVVADLLAQCRALKILVTSRAPLQLQMEQQYRVPPLALPPPTDEPAPALVGGGRLTDYAAVQLFVQCARLVRPDFSLTEANRQAVVEICQRLDGLPLALELAAARVQLLPPAALLARLKSRLALLTGGPRNLPARQQTMRAALDWSYDLLDEAEKALYRRLAVFARGFSLEAAAAVAEDGEPTTEAVVSVLEGLSSLTDKSLIHQMESVDGEPRFRLLQIVREYGRERLAESGEAAAVRQRHLLWYLRLAEQAAPQLRGPQQVTWLDRLEQEHNNLRAALRWAVETGQTELELRLVGALAEFWQRRGYLSEGREWLEKALRRDDEAQGAAASAARQQARAMALSEAGSLAWRQGDYGSATVLHEASLTLYQSIGDRWGVAFALNNLGVQATRQGDYAPARRLLEESLDLYQAQGDKWGMCAVLINLGLLAEFEDDLPRARQLYTEGLALGRTVGDRWAIAALLHNLGDVARYAGDYAQAVPLYEESIELGRQTGDKLVSAQSLAILAKIAHKQGDAVRAIQHFQASLTVFREFGHQDELTQCLQGLAGVLADQGQAVAAARLFSAAEALRELLGVALPALDRHEHEQQVASVRHMLGDALFAATWAEGRALTLDEAVAHALEMSVS